MTTITKIIDEKSKRKQYRTNVQAWRDDEIIAHMTALGCSYAVQKDGWCVTRTDIVTPCDAVRHA